MPKYLILRKSGVHRAACFALYRALLRQKHELNLNQHQQRLFRKPIQAVFKRNSKLQKPNDVSTALKLGYETLEGLHDAVRQRRILDRILELAAQSRSKPKPKDLPSLPGTKAVQVGKPPKVQAAPYPGAAHTLDRPFHNLSGRRHVPVLVNANRVPILRLKKPQPPFLSRIIRDTVKTREHRLRRGVVLADELPIAEDEDEWDLILQEQTGLHLTDPSESRWQDETQQASYENHKSQVEAIQKRARISAEMYSIVQRERALANEEILRIRDGKHKARKARRLARKGLTESEIQKKLYPPNWNSVVRDAQIVAHEMPKQGQGEAPQTYKEQEWRQGRNKYHTPEELKRLYEASLHPRTDEEIARIKEARVKRKEEKAERKARKVKREQERAALSEQRVNREAGNSKNKPWGVDIQEYLNEKAPFLKPPIHPAAKRMAIRPQQEVPQLLKVNDRSRIRHNKGSGSARSSAFQCTWPVRKT